MEPVNVENEPDIPEPLPLVTLKVGLSVLDTSPDEEESVFVTAEIEPSMPVNVNCAFVPVTDIGVLVIVSVDAMVPEFVLKETEKEVTPPLPSTLSMVIVESSCPYTNRIVSFAVYPLPAFVKLTFESVIPDTLILVTDALPVKSP